MYRGASFWSGVVSGGISQLEDTQSYMKRELTTSDYSVHTTRNVTGAIGIMAGMEYGAVLGSAVLPGLGTIVGSFLGFMVGNRVGSYAGYQVGNIVFKQAPLLLTGHGGTQLKLAAKSEH